MGPISGSPNPSGIASPCLVESFTYQLAAEVYVHPVLEIDIYYRETEVRYRPDILNPGKSVHSHFHGISDEFLDLFGRKAFGYREHLHQIRRYVGNASIGSCL